ncbi:hypothetical protein FisN_23Hh093 [Fistulifera solaris]|uniref:Uncharacterized protein n=1 Tax=Fistulifera solaris TaxID=1519565 RepID=A0A1Z5KM92_FISSO|nr:hypothetical protein FisN_23Hh093 [Fistulifera solaris]|eukprot:GAX27443.1 hypothetical protein FisN_23Hh093 [Fistulifera solaris]
MIESGYQSGFQVIESRNDVNEKDPVDLVTRAAGQLLWNLLLNRKIPEDGDVDWLILKREYPLLSSVTQIKLIELLMVIRSIVILDDSIDDRVEQVLAEYNGKIVVVRRNLTEELYRLSPDRFHAHVADFNDNLSYCMQTTRGFPANPSMLTADEWEEEIALFEKDVKEKLKSCHIEVQSSFLKTDKTVAQPAHVDYSWKVLSERADELWLAFFPLTSQGMILQLWPPHGSQGLLVFIPLGKMLLVPSDTIHGGGFRTFPIHDLGTRDESYESESANHTHNDECDKENVYVGNMRYHLYIATHGKSLPKFAQNVYTIKGDKRRELSQVCTNASGVNEKNSLLMRTLFE